MIYIANAFSINMLPEIGEHETAVVEFTALNKEDVKQYLGGEFKSVVGHPDLAATISGELGIQIPHNREPIKLAKSDVLIVAQYIGPRLPEGSTKLPEGATIRYFRVLLK